MLRDDGGDCFRFLTGPSGIGKSYLLWVFHRRATQQDIPVMWIDACRVEPSPPAIQRRLGMTLGQRPLARFCAGHDTPVLLLDSFECWHEIEDWFMQQVLPNLPANLRVIIASRLEPKPEWRQQPLWSRPAGVLSLDGLSADESRTYLQRRNIEPAWYDALLEFAAGSPLLLAHSADLAVQGGDPCQAENNDSAFARLAEYVTRVAYSHEQHHALGAAAVVRELNADLLANMLAVDDATTLYRWLARLACMRQGDYGIAPSAPVRRALLHDMKWHFPGRHEACVQRAFDWIAERIETADNLTWHESMRLVADGLYALRGFGVMRQLFAPAGMQALHFERARPQDFPPLAALVGARQGEQSRVWFEFWCRRQPYSVFLWRNHAGEVCGFFMMLDMEQLQPEDRVADPLVACLWRHLCAGFDIKPQEHVPFIRFRVDTLDSKHMRSPVWAAMAVAISSYNLTANRLRLTAQVFPDTPEWGNRARLLDMQRLMDGACVIDGRSWQIYYNDWALEHPTRYYRRFAEHCIALESTCAGISAADTEAGILMLDEQTFKTTAKDALKHCHSDTALQSSALLGCALVAAWGPSAGVERQAALVSLRSCLRAAVAALEEEGRSGSRWRQILEHTYLQAVVGQKQIAADLGLTYSAYRRQLAAAREAWAQQLWRMEQQARCERAKGHRVHWRTDMERSAVDCRQAEVHDRHDT